MKLFLACFFSFFFFTAFAKKDTVITYYGYNQNEVGKKDYYIHYRKTFKISETTFGFLQYYRTGVLQMSGYLEASTGHKTGLYVYYNNRGIKIKEENYKSDLKEGIYKKWYDNGTPETEGSYKNNKQNGLWKYWYADGSNQSEGNFLLGEQEGEWKNWHLGNKIASIGNYKSGKKEGEWKRWFKSGAIDQEGVYIEDKREGEWIFYFESGKVSAKEIYENGIAIKIEFWDEEGNEVKPTKILEKDPEFPGGEGAMIKFIQKHVMYPELSREMGEQGTIYISFIVGVDGKLNDITVLIGVSELLDAEALRVVKKMPNWTPGFSHNRIIEIDFLIPIKFTIA